MFDEGRVSSRTSDTVGLDRRAFMAAASALGLGATALPAALWARTDGGQEALTKADISAAARVAGLEFTDEELDLMVEDLNGTRESYDELRTVEIPNSVVPALHFEPALPGASYPTESSVFRYTRPRGLARPADLEALAFAPVTELAELVRSRQVTSTELTEMYLGRLKAHGETLECLITLTEELALRQAARADAEIARGYYRGPLHGIPWGAKDLLAEDSYRTTWGARPYEDQHIPDDSTVGRRLEAAGAVLVAKLTLGALAQGDRWYGGQTKNPWNLEQGSSGSSAGSASAVVAGLVGFTIGSETLGSIVSPSTRCGASGLRPTYGRVSRAGAMALSWSMDKLGPICRSVEDCALVLQAIHGADGMDPTARDVAFDWDPGRPLSDLRVAYVPSAFEAEREDEEWQAFDEASLEVVRGLGIDPVPLELPDDIPYGAMRIILSAEAGAAFDELTRSGRDDLLVRQTRGAWPNTFRKARMIPAVEYIQANRLRTIAMHRFERAMEGIDVVVTPSFGGSMLLLTNLTGHPQAVIPNGYRSEDGTPTSISFVGKLFGDAEALRLALAVQDATEHHLRRPPEFA
ncbi:amidase family protein [Candidatus Palauibacter sp.]|uniref:amidase family protein n=1 Tax=Candidatus Palauibacter sp. TaxID=3101350 RepID=UPI003B5202C3